MSKQTGMQAAAKAGIEDFNGIIQDRLHGIVRYGLVAMFEHEVTSLCGETYRPSEKLYRRAGSDPVTIQTEVAPLNGARAMLMKWAGREGVLTPKIDHEHETKKKTSDRRIQSPCST